jgi:flavin-dependent dehydrogenase
MRHIETIIVGGGPAGSSCARELVRAGRECLVLERAPMPRVKLCAGWITPKVLNDLEMTPEEYPQGLIKIEKFKICLGKKSRIQFTLSTRQYSIRRVEFDHWLLKRSGAELITHSVRSIEYQGDRYVIDDQFACRYLVGAGGEGCPVQRIFFKNREGTLILAKEIEYEADPNSSICTLWVPFGGKGYAWHMPKADAINIGYGCAASSIEPSNMKHFWEKLIEILLSGGQINETSPDPSGWAYHLRMQKRQTKLKQNNAYIIGDAAGLATLDLGEGIGPAIESGILAAHDILGRDEYVSDKITQYSLTDFLKLPNTLASMLHWILSKIL